MKNMISHLNEMISMVIFIFEYGDSESKMGLKNLPQYHVIDDVIDNGRNSHKSAIYFN